MNPEEVRYAKTHEWVHVSTEADGAKVATVGLSVYAVEALTDLVYIELPEPGRQVGAGQSLGEIESVKAVSDLYAPVDGEVLEVNESLREALDSLSDDPLGAGWIAKLRVSDEAGLADLLDYSEYQAQCEEG